MKFMKNTIIARPGCPPLMTKLTVFECARFSLRVHTFHRSDPDELHDHPFDFVSIIIRGGYWERGDDMNRRWRRPGSILFRRAEHRHRIELDEGKTATTICLTSGPRRAWGFWTSIGFVGWRRFFNRSNAGVGDCPGVKEDALAKFIRKAKRERRQRYGCDGPQGPPPDGMNQ